MLYSVIILHCLVFHFSDKSSQDENCILPREIIEVMNTTYYNLSNLTTKSACDFVTDIAYKVTPKSLLVTFVSKTIIAKKFNK